MAKWKQIEQIQELVMELALALEDLKLDPQVDEGKPRDKRKKRDSKLKLIKGGKPDQDAD
jgi:hypothetical protein